MRPFKFQFSAMTTPCVVVVHHEREDVAQGVAKKIHALTKQLEKKYNFYNKHSWLTQVINEREHAVVALSDDELNVFRQIKHYQNVTQGVFDTSIGTLKTHDAINDGALAKTVAGFEGAQDQRKQHFADAMGVDAWYLDGNTLVFKHPLTRLDLGGVIKEFAVDESARLLKQHDCGGCISFGGDMFVVGRKPDGNPIKVGIKNPFDKTKSLACVPVEDAALTTSGTYERVDAHTGQHHIIAPSRIHERSNADERIVSATIIAPSALLSGVLSTACIIEPNLLNTIELNEPIRYFLVNQAGLVAQNMV